MLKIAWLLALGLFALSANADHIASGETGEAVATNSTRGEVLATLSLKKLSFSLPSRPDLLTTCKLHRGFGQVWMSVDDPNGYQDLFATGFPDDFIDIEKSLKSAQFKRKSEVTSYGVTTDLTAEYKNGVLKIESRYRGTASGFSNLEIHTMGSVVEATKIKWQVNVRSGYGNNESSAICEVIPVS
jgi:hypothetical protein